MAADIVPLDKATGDGKSPGGGLAVMAWAVAVLILLALCWVGFRKSKRTHLD
jgi:hypothetical protein